MTSHQRLLADAGGTGVGTVWAVVGIVAVVLAIGVAALSLAARAHNTRLLAGARAATVPLFDRLTADVRALGARDHDAPGHRSPHDDARARARAGAAGRLAEADALLAGATTTADVFAARQTVLQGLYLTRSARAAAGTDPGPPVPALDGLTAAHLSTPATITVGDARHDARHDAHHDGRPDPHPDAPWYFGGGYGVPGGWFGVPFWEHVAPSGLLAGDRSTGFAAFGAGPGGEGGDRGHDR